MTDYGYYRLSKEEKLKYYTAACIALAFLGLLFYRSFLMAGIIALAAIPLKRCYAGYLKNKRLDRLREGFRDALYSISGSVAAGRQLPYAVGEAADAAVLSYGEDSDIACELAYIVRSYRESHGETETLLGDLGRRSGLEEIKQFAQSCSICRRCGGDMEAVSLRSAALLLDRMDFAREVKGLIAQKKSDIAILVSMPIFILIFLNLVSFSYLEPLYSGLSGRLIMTCCLGAVIGALLWCLKITEIDL